MKVHELVIKDPIRTRARDAFRRLLVRLHLRPAPLKFANREHWAPMPAEVVLGRMIRSPVAPASREAIRAAVLAVPGVTSCQFRDDDGTLPPRSFEVVVRGGEDSRVAEAIFLEKAAGVGTCGTTSVVVSPGNVVRFTRPARARRWRMDHPRLAEALGLLPPVLVALAAAAAAAWVLLS